MITLRLSGAHVFFDIEKIDRLISQGEAWLREGLQLLEESEELGMHVNASIIISRNERIEHYLTELRRVRFKIQAGML